MNYLNFTSAAVALRIAQSDAGQGTLLDQVAPFLTLTPGLILDIEGVLLTSMAIGELVNVVKEYQRQWEDRFYGLFLVHVSDRNWQTLVTAGLTELIRPFPSADAAWHAIEKLK